MPRDINGNYTLPPGINPVVPHTVIEAEWANPTLDDVASNLTDSLSRSGLGGMLAPFKFADGNLAAPGQSWVNEPTSGMYRAGTGDVRYAVQGVDVLRMRSTQIDFLVPTNISGGALTLTSTLTINHAGAAPQILITGKSVGGDSMRIYSNVAASGSQLESRNNAGSDFTPLTLVGATVDLFARTGVATIARVLRAAAAAGTDTSISVNGGVGLVQLIATSGVANGDLYLAPKGAGLLHFFEAGNTKDRMRVTLGAPGSGVSMDVVDIPGTDFEPLSLKGEVIDLFGRTGVGTTARGLRVQAGAGANSWLTIQGSVAGTVVFADALVADAAFFLQVKGAGIFHFTDTAAARDRMRMQLTAAGSGVVLEALNPGQTDFEPFAIRGENVLLAGRTGVNTFATAFIAGAVAGADSFLSVVANVGIVNIQAAGAANINLLIQPKGTGFTRFISQDATRDRGYLINEAGGSGFTIQALNAGATDYTPLSLTGLSIDLIARTGVLTAALVARVNSTGLIFPTDNTFDIGAVATGRPRDLFVGRNFVVAGNSTLGDADADILAARGVVTVRRDVDGNTLRLINNTAAGSVSISLDPGNNGFGVRDALIVATNSGANAITVDFKVANGGAPATALTILPSRAIVAASDLAVTGNLTMTGLVQFADGANNRAGALGNVSRYVAGDFQNFAPTGGTWRVINQANTQQLLALDNAGTTATFFGTVVAPAATAAKSSLRAPHGVPPSAPVDGDIWTTVAGLFSRINGVNTGPYATSTSGAARRIATATVAAGVLTQIRNFGGITLARTATGVFTVTFAAAEPDVLYAISITAGQGGSNTGMWTTPLTPLTVNGFTFETATWSTNRTLFDPTHLSVLIF